MEESQNQTLPTTPWSLRTQRNGRLVAVRLEPESDPRAIREHRPISADSYSKIESVAGDSG